ncbi:MAG TPA: serine/threonine-protein kinase [Kofleriaceae bacterium]|jgi:serine/threonine-protein kinase|nr:serine/threonine-protein kinase [Kofleriaceae bacterium]
MVDDREDSSTDETVPKSVSVLAATEARFDLAATASPATVPEGARRANAVPAELDGSRYRLGELLGKGGMGEVVLAHDDQIGRDVAVKRIRSTEPSAEELARFVREARIQGRLEHPAVVPVHDLAFDREGRPFFVMKRLTGTVMSELLARIRDGLDPDPLAARRRLLRAFADVCLAIELAHSKGIVHRDLKPSNIMLGDFGEVYVLDWGIARVANETDAVALRPSQADLELDTGRTRAGTVLGTPAYMAPEQLAGEAAGPKADLYALGCVLYEIVAGEPVHSTKRAIASVAARPSVVRPDAPPELDALCEQATRLDPEQRPSSARALGDAVQAYLDGDRDLARRTELARTHVAEANAALGRSDSADDRRAAMRAAGHALALDPTSVEAADIVTSLVLKPPHDVPAEVEIALDRIDTQTGREHGRLAAFSLVGYLAFIPLLLWTGVRVPWLVIAFGLLAIASSTQIYSMVRRDRIYGWRIYVNACINATIIGLVCRMVGPFIVAPTLVATTLMAYAAHPRFGRIVVVASILAAAVLVPWGLELAGVLSPTYTFVDGTIVLSSAVLTFRSVPVQLAFLVLLFALLAVVAVLSRMMAQRQRDANRRVELQAWQLRQLVPSHDR